LAHFKIIHDKREWVNLMGWKSRKLFDAANQKAIYRPLFGPLIISNKKAKTRQEFP
jgi:hypothetical protein